MITIEQIDELRKRLDVTYEEAKEALEACNGDMLEAIIYLEKTTKKKEILVVSNLRKNIVKMVFLNL